MSFLHIRRASERSASPPEKLTICQSATPGLAPLPVTVTEVDAIQTLQTQTGRLHLTRLDGREATVGAVLQYMKESAGYILLAMPFRTPLTRPIALFSSSTVG
jgi:hypothetical protein